MFIVDDISYHRWKIDEHFESVSFTFPSDNSNDDKKL